MKHEIPKLLKPMIILTAIFVGICSIILASPYREVFISCAGLNILLIVLIIVRIHTKIYINFCEETD